MKGYKAFDKDLKCRNFQFKINEVFEIKEDIKMCSKGFHFCEKILNVYNYYTKDINTRICEVEALGQVETEGDKSCTNKIRIIRELTYDEILDAFLKKSNTGSYNSGHYNSGHSNTGSYNSGDYNSGHYNSGNYNSGNYNSGFFNTNSPKVRLFNKETNLEFSDKIISKIRNLNIKPILQWIVTKNMTDDEKAKFPSHKTTGGFLRDTGRIDYSKLSDDELTFIKSLPNFDNEIFKEITGLDLMKPKTIKITHENQDYEIDIEKAKELGIIKK